MEFQPKSCELKSGKSIIIRVAVFEDAEQLIDLKRDYLKDTSSIPLTLDEYPIDLKKEQKIISEFFASSNSILLVAEHDNELIGNIDLSGSPRSKMFHTGMLGMGIKDKWRNQGLGRYLIESVIDWAKKHTALEIIWLDVYASNKLGNNLYKKMDFIEYGRINDFFKEESGYQNKIQMYKRIKEKLI